MAGYRLAGAQLDHLCCRHLYGTDRMLVAWPAGDHAIVMLVGPLDNAAEVVAEGAGRPEASDHGPTTEAEFHQAMKEVYERAKREAGYTATYFIRMVSQRGGLETAKSLINGSTPSQGFTALWERSRLDLTVEAVVLDPMFAHLFTSDEVQTARRRLAEHDYVPPGARK